MSNALDDLIAKVEAGTAKPADFRCLEVPMQDMRYTEMPNSARMAYKGSLDAAKALHEAALPGWAYNDHLRRGMRYTTFIGKSIEDEPVDAVSNDPARAWLIAILKALIAGEKGES